MCPACSEHPSLTLLQLGRNSSGRPSKRTFANRKKPSSVSEPPAPWTLCNRATEGRELSMFKYLSLFYVWSVMIKRDVVTWHNIPREVWSSSDFKSDLRFRGIVYHEHLLSIRTQDPGVTCWLCRLSTAYSISFDLLGIARQIARGSHPLYVLYCMWSKYGVKYAVFLPTRHSCALSRRAFWWCCYVKWNCIWNISNGYVRITRTISKLPVGLETVQCSKGCGMRRCPKFEGVFWGVDLAIRKQRNKICGGPRTMSQMISSLGQKGMKKIQLTQFGHTATLYIAKFRACHS